ncbi:MAG: site-specific DNA-methyltransferase [Desulfobacteraceae bacterium]|nr:MAG: site-specific DNA-methyltransferase [Desulfobacteraceae bacterium]
MPTLQFKGKNIIWNHHLSIPYHTLDEVEKLDFRPEKAKGNLIIEGDNLLALKALLPQYAGKIKCIYIDPPYNTGNEGWVYNDNVNSPMLKEWLGKEVGKDDLTRHDKWLCMMVPRLKLFKELLSNDGIIAISIDDNEVANLCMIMDEIFTEENKLAVAPWLSEPSGGKEKTGLRGGHEYLIIYHNGNISKITQEEISTGELNLKDKKGMYRKGRELRKWGGISLRENRPNQFYPLTAPDGTEVYPIRNDGKEGHWRWGKNNQKIIDSRKDIEYFYWEKCKYDEGKSYKGEKERWVPFEKIRDKKKSVGWSTWLATVGYNSDATRELKELFGEKAFDTPKPTSLIRWFISLHDDDDAIILDSFAGSGTAMHAVMDLNKEDGGNRRCILVQMTEATEAEPKKNICKDITRERVKRAIEKFGYDEGFQYLRVGIPLDAETLLSGKLPTFKQFADYVYYLCTGESLKNKSAVNEKTYFVGECNGSVIYLVYKQDFDALTRMALNLSLAERIVNEHPKKRIIVYAPACFLEEDYMREKSIDYVGIPYNLFRRAGA